MHFNIPNIIWIYSGGVEYFAKDILLSRIKRASYGISFRGMICVSPGYNCLSWVFIVNSVFEPFEDEQTVSTL